MLELDSNKNQDQTLYFLENPKELNLKINNLRKLRKEISVSSIPNSYKTNMLERIDNNLKYLDRIYQALEKNRGSIIPIAVTSFLMGLGAGIIAKSVFDSYLENSNKKIADTAIKELLEKLNKY